MPGNDGPAVAEHSSHTATESENDEPEQLHQETTNQGADNITNTQYNSFTDTLFSASGFSFSIDGTTGNLIATI